MYLTFTCRSPSCSKGHGSLTSSGIATPFLLGDSSTPSSSTAVDSRERELSAKNLEDVNEKLQRKQSFTRAVLGAAPPTRSPDGDAGPTKEHIEQGRVKRDVYVQYIAAASKVGFALFVGATVLSQLVSVAANNTLRAWGEHNREAGSNDGVGRYLVEYGALSLSSTIFSAAAAIIIWVFCSIRSARRLHDQMLHAVMRAPMSFFEQTPTGRSVRWFRGRSVQADIPFRSESSTCSRVISMSSIRSSRGSFRTSCARSSSRS